MGLGYPILLLHTIHREILVLYAVSDDRETSSFGHMARAVDQYKVWFFKLSRLFYLFIQLLQSTVLESYVWKREFLEKTK